MAKGNILIADDDAAIRTVLNQALARAGYAPRATGNAATLWRWISQGDGDLVITDVLMPDENAFDLIPRVKKLRPDLPIIVMSAQNTFMTAITATERGAYEYLPKPFDLNELIAVVGRALAEPRRKAQRLSAEASDGHFEEAARLLGEARRELDDVGSPEDRSAPEVVAETKAKAREALGDEAFEAVYGTGLGPDGA